MSGGWKAGGAAAVAAACLVWACAGLEPNPNVVGTYSARLSPYNYKEEGAVAVLVAGVDAARFIRKEPYFPLFVLLANRSAQTFEITRESFMLEDPLGRQYAMPPAREVTANYPRLDLDRRLFRQNRQFTASAVNLMTSIPSEFFPSASRRTVLNEQVSLPPQGYLEDVLYFPIPESGLNGVPLRLLFRDRTLSDPIQVVFEVPKTLGIMEKRQEDAARDEAEDR